MTWHLIHHYHPFICSAVWIQAFISMLTWLNIGLFSYLICSDMTISRRIYINKHIISIAHASVLTVLCCISQWYFVIRMTAELSIASFAGVLIVSGYLPPHQAQNRDKTEVRLSVCTIEFMSSCMSPRASHRRHQHEQNTCNYRTLS